MTPPEKSLLFLFMNTISNLHLYTNNIRVYRTTMINNLINLKNMKNIGIYYFAILAPIALLIWVSTTGNTSLFVILLLTYAIPYRITIDGMRLVQKDLMKWGEIWRLFFPWVYYDYFKELYFRK